MLIIYFRHIFYESFKNKNFNIFSTSQMTCQLGRLIDHQYVDLYKHLQIYSFVVWCNQRPRISNYCRPLDICLKKLVRSLGLEFWILMSCWLQISICIGSVCMAILINLYISNHGRGMSQFMIIWIVLLLYILAFEWMEFIFVKKIYICITYKLCKIAHWNNLHLVDVEIYYHDITLIIKQFTLVSYFISVDWINCLNSLANKEN